MPKIILATVETGSDITKKLTMELGSEMPDGKGHICFSNTPYGM